MTVAIDQRLTIGGVTPFKTIGEFKGISDSSPLGASVLDKNQFSNDNIISALLKLLGDDSKLSLSKDDILSMLLSALNIDALSDYAQALSDMIHGLGNNLMRALEERINRMLSFIANDSALCDLLKAIDNFNYRDLKFNYIITGFISLSYDICNTPMIDRLLGNIADENGLRHITLLLFADINTSGNSRLMIDLINSPASTGILDGNDWILDVISSTYQADYDTANYDTITKQLFTASNPADRVAPYLPLTVKPIKLLDDITLNVNTGVSDPMLLVGGLLNIAGDTDILTYTLPPVTQDYINSVYTSIVDRTLVAFLSSVYNISKSDAIDLYIKLFGGYYFNEFNTVLDNLDPSTNIDSVLMMNTNTLTSNCALIKQHAETPAEFTTGLDIRTL